MIPKTVFSGHGDQRDEHGQPQRVHRVGRRDGVPCGGEPVLEGAVEDHPERDEEQQRQIAERAEAEEVPTRASCLVA